jgi:hypothetical protein
MQPVNVIGLLVMFFASAGFGVCVGLEAVCAPRPTASPAARTTAKLKCVLRMMRAPLRVLLVAVVLGPGLRGLPGLSAISAIVARRLHARGLTGSRVLVHRVAILIDLDVRLVVLSGRGADVRALPLFLV